MPKQNPHIAEHNHCYVVALSACPFLERKNEVGQGHHQQRRTGNTPRARNRNIHVPTQGPKEGQQNEPKHNRISHTKEGCPPSTPWASTPPSSRPTLPCSPGNTSTPTWTMCTLLAPPIGWAPYSARSGPPYATAPTCMCTWAKPGPGTPPVKSPPRSWMRCLLTPGPLPGLAIGLSHPMPRASSCWAPP